MICVPAAHATLSLNFNGTNVAGAISGGTTILDGGVGDLDGVVNKQITTLTQLGTLTATLTTGTSQSPNGAINFTLNGTPSATGSFTLSVSDNGFTNPVPTNLSLSADIIGNSSPQTGSLIGVQGTLTAVGFFSSSNTTFVTSGSATSTAGPIAFQAGTATGTANGINGASPYSLTEYVTINITALSTTTDPTFTVTGHVATIASQVPEPTSIVLLGGALLFTVGTIRRKARRA